MKKILLALTIIFVSGALADSSISDSNNVQFTLDGTDAEVFDDSDDFKHAEIDSRDFDRAFRDPIQKKKIRKRKAKSKVASKKATYKKAKRKVAFKSSNKRSNVSRPIASPIPVRIASASPKRSEVKLPTPGRSKARFSKGKGRKVASVELSFFDRVVMKAQKGYVEAKKVAQLEYGKLLNKYEELKKRWSSSK